ncbi:MAG: large conductance mechanosensitive channel protein MscL [Lachnospiraceae bacterium]|nr:large conductance mechanosensitive channel protein MscL [Lachnospiraceae bacterium]
MLKEFKEFALKGNMIDMAVGVIIGGAFGALVTALVNNIFMPLLSLITAGADFSTWFIALDGNKYATAEAAAEAGAAVVNFGLFISAIINFLLMAFVVFLFVRAINKARAAAKPAEEAAPEEPTTKVCPFCQSEIAIAATRCPHCTSELPESPIDPAA